MCQTRNTSIALRHMFNKFDRVRSCREPKSLFGISDSKRHGQPTDILPIMLGSCTENAVQ